MTKLLVGCPLVGNPEAGRNWILSEWYLAAMASAIEAGVEVALIVTVHPDDSESKRLLAAMPFVTTVDSAFVGGDGNHKWNVKRYEVMVNLRNELLGEVRKQEPDYFLSMDSDVLLHPNAVASALDAFAQKPNAWAVGTPFFVSKHGTQHPNNGRWVNTRMKMFQRNNYNYLAKMDILIGGYMMSPDGYHVDYEFDARGEDLGWSKAVLRAGGELWWDGRVVNKHVMDVSMLNTVDTRVGF